MNRSIQSFFSISLTLVFLVVTTLTHTGCKTSNAVKGGVIGAAGGAVIGGVIGGKKNTALGAIIGAGVGGAAGVLIGRYMDKQAEEMRRDLEGAKIERVGEGIKITFDSGLLFDVNSHRLKSASKTNLADLSEVLAKYDDTNILVEGHTDNTGTDEYNLELSEKRANSVGNYLKISGVDGTRLILEGYGEAQPIADNESATGRQANRRVDIAIFANDKLKKAAKKGKLGEIE